MLTYNTHLKPLVLPEYGRTVQSMVDYCCTIEDREERTRCAYAIIRTMKTLFLPDKNEVDADRKYWDHLAIMSNFTLDIDWPFEVIQPDSIEPRPDHVDYDQSNDVDRQYGRNITQMIDIASDMEDGEDRDALVILLANQMKKISLSWDTEGVDDERIFKDLNVLSNGRITIDGETVKLCEYKDAPSIGKKKKKK